MSDADANDTITDDRIGQIQHRVAAVNREAAAAVAQAAGLSDAQPAVFELAKTHDELVDAYGELRSAIDLIEHAMDDLDAGRETPRKIKRKHAERLEETYDDPVLYLALQLVECNRREWLHASPETNGAHAVRRHGLTENQRKYLNELQNAWDADDRTECVVCGQDLGDPKNAGDPDENGEWVCRRESCRAAHDVDMTVPLGDAE